MTTFKQLSDQAIKASPLLTDDEIAILLRDNLQEPLQRYLFRIAVYAVRQIATSEGHWRDEQDYIDAVQECATRFGYILDRYDPTKAKLATYAQHSFRTAARHYLMCEQRGGMVRKHNGKMPILPVIGLDDVVLTDIAPRHISSSARFGDEITPEPIWDDFNSYDEPPLGYGDPLDELIRHETAKDAIKFASKRASTRAEATRLSHEIGRYNK